MKDITAGDTYSTLNFKEDTLDYKISQLKATDPVPDCQTIYFNDEVKCVLISSDEKFLFAGLSNGDISMFYMYSIDELDDIDEEKCEAIKVNFSGHTDELKALCITSDSKSLISGSYDKTIKIWDIETQTEDGTLEGHEDKILALALSPDDKFIISTSIDHMVRIWNFRTKMQEKLIEDIEANIYSIAISYDSRIAVFGCSDQKLRIWNIKENKKGGVLSGHQWPVYSVAISHDNKWAVSCGMDHTVRKWNLLEMKEEKILADWPDTIYSVYISQDDDYVVYGRYDGFIGIIHMGSNQEIEIPGHDSCVYSVYISNSSKYIISGGRDKALRLWKFSEWPKEHVLAGHEGRIYDIAISQNSKIMATAGDDFKILLWNIANDELEGKLVGHDGPVHSVLLTSDGTRAISGSQDQTIRVWDLLSQSEEFVLKGHDECILSMCITSDDRYVISGSIDKTVRVWDLDEKSLLSTLRGHEHKVNAVCIAATDDTRVFSASKDKTIRCWNLIDFQPFYMLEGHEDEISSICITSDGKFLISAGQDSTIRVWNLDYQYQEIVLNNKEIGIYKLCLSSDDKYLFAQTDKRYIKMWSFPDRQAISTLYDYKDVLSVSLSPDNQYIAISTDKYVRTFKSPISRDMVVVPYNYSYFFKCMIYKLLNNYEVKFTDYFNHHIICPWNISILHILSYMNLTKFLQDSIRTGGLFISCCTGETPLKIALNRKSKLCAEIIIQLFPLIYSNNPSAFNYLRNDLPLLNKSSLPSLNLVYEMAFPAIENHSVPTFGNLLHNPPIIIAAHLPLIDPSQFIAQQENMNELSADTELVFRRSLFALDLEPGSIHSIKFIRSLLKCNQIEIFRTEFIKAVLKYKWRQIMWVMWLQAFIYFSLVLILFLHTVADRENNGPLVLIFVINTFFLCYELVQSRASIGSYITDFWNTIDLSRIIMSYIYPISCWSDANRITKDVMLAILTILAWIRLVGYIRMFDRSRYLIKLIIEVIKDMGPFFVIFVVSTFGMTVAFYCDQSDNTSFWFQWLNTYTLAYGAFDYSDYSDLQICIFIAASLMNTLILLNLIIAIMGHTLEKVTDMYDIADLQEMADIIMEIDSVSFWGRKKGQLKYLQQCSAASSNEKDEGKDNDIVDLIGDLNNKSIEMDKNLESIVNRIEHMDARHEEEKNIDDYINDIKSEFSSLRKEMKSQVDVLKEELELIRQEVGNSSSVVS